MVVLVDVKHFSQQHKYMSNRGSRKESTAQGLRLPPEAAEFCRLIARVLRRLGPKIETATAPDEGEDPKTELDEDGHG